MNTASWHALLLLSLHLTLGWHFCEAVPVEDEVIDLPGLPYPAPFRHYSGYLEVPGDKHLHYWFVECETDPSSAPLLLWLNGGPGCSSMDGLLTENGPFHVNSDSETLYYNVHSWNKIANVLYLDSPAGVGFSYSASQNLSSSDDQTANDNYAALLQFFDKFPEYESNDFYITGESYAGVYIPTLAVLVLNETRNINLKGIAIGNGAHDDEMNMNSVVWFAASHALLDTELVNKVIINCCNSANPFGCNFYNNSNNATCKETILEAVLFVLESRVDPYSIYSDCESPLVGLSEFLKTNLPSLISESRSERLHQHAAANVESPGLPCQSAVIESLWINQPEVRKALHIPEEAEIWKDCNNVILYTYEQQYPHMGPFYQVLLQEIRALLYNGDTDCICNFIGGEWFADSLGKQVIEPYRPWRYANQTAGFIKQYTNISYATVLGSGHMVPADKPAQILELISNFIFQQPY